MNAVYPVLTIAFLVSCQARNEVAADPAPENVVVQAEAPAAIDVNKPESLVGLPHADVKAACDTAGVRNRIIELDGESQPVTRDYRPDRLNFKVKDGKITAVSKG
jgi:hypothetical protein